MSDIAIQIQGLSKRYQIGQRAVSQTFREAIVGAVQAPFRRLKRRGGSNDSESFWALKDISLDVKRGEVVGIIGRNGAGKSTLLKILSRITEPTEGEVIIHGRVGSLLEVGTGFHSELTGRENIYLNGAILGMRRAEISQKFDEIVAFSEIEKFLDTPVKRYSSGMYMRLAFAVAAHLEPEILIVDEVLAVGDATFQKKCLGKMQDVAGQGRTVLFVSHNMAAIEGLCSHGVFLDRGQVGVAGSQRQCIEAYIRSLQESAPPAEFRFGSANPPQVGSPSRLVEASVSSGNTSASTGLPIGAPIDINVTAHTTSPLLEPSLGIGIDNEMGLRVVTLHSQLMSRASFGGSVLGDFRFACRLVDLALMPGNYTVKLSLEGSPGALHVIERALSFSVLSTDYLENAGYRGRGVVLCKAEWQCSK